MQNLHQAFTFIRLKELQDCSENLGINYILSLININNSDFKEICRIQLNKNVFLILWQFQNPKKTMSVEDVFAVVQSSGSTGNQKIIKVPYTCINANILCLRYVKFLTLNNVDWYAIR